VMITFDIDDLPIPLPCGCRIFDMKVYVDGRETSGVFRIEAHRRSTLEKAHQSARRWTIHRYAETERGLVLVHNGEPMLFVTVTCAKVELRCKHHPERAT